MNIKVVTAEDKATVFLSGTVDIASAESLKTTLGRIGEQATYKDVTLDFKEVDSIGSSAIGALLLSHKEFSAKNIKFTLVNINKDIKALFKIIKLDKIFKL